VNTHIVRELPIERTRVRVLVVSLLAPLTVLAGIAWAFIQPYRLTVLHPHGQGFWWLAVEPPLLVCFAGVVFGYFVARQLIADIEEEDRGTAR
jgi:hypothetical protein